MKYSIDESRNWYNALPAKRSSAGMILRHGDTVLMIKDDYKDAMTFPGGVIDPGESPLTAALREASEEVGISLTSDNIEFFTAAYVQESHGFLDRYHFFFLAQLDDEVAVHTDSGVEYYEWVPIAQLGEKAGGRGTHVAIQRMLETGIVEPYIEV